MTSLANLSRKELLATCETLIRELGSDRAQAVLMNVVKPKAIASIVESDVDKERETKKLRKEFDFSRYPQKQVAFWIGYFGENYTGLATASTKTQENDRTIEWSFLDGLKKVKLIDGNGDFESWSYSRCGRTDRGVSGLGQVISMKVRCTEGPNDMDYASMLNGNLPKDIFVLAWAPVNEGSTEPGSERQPFNARFQCRSRTYRYFFRSAKLNLDKMREACALLEGTHDFRNFCKIDIDNVKTFERTIESCKIIEGQCLNDEVKFVEVRGTAFLWHQIRIIMAVLFHVGTGLEEPTVVSQLFDISACPARPAFAMAAELPLLLYASSYDPSVLNWRFSEKNVGRLISRFYDRLGQDMIRCELTKTFLDVLTNEPFPKVTDTNDMDHEECSPPSKRDRHRSFMTRIKCKSVEQHRSLERTTVDQREDE